MQSSLVVRAGFFLQLSSKSDATRTSVGYSEGGCD
jgi:hypothetical protein